MSLYCANCNEEINENQRCYIDEYMDQAFCTRSCFRDWATDNHEVIANWYRKLYLSESGGA